MTARQRVTVTASRVESSSGKATAYCVRPRSQRTAALSPRAEDDGDGARCDDQPMPTPIPIPIPMTMSFNKSAKGKPITTSVPTFAIRFHTNGEELEELYPSEEEDKSLVEDKCAESSVASEPLKQESSPMRDYLKFGKRSSSIDAGINDTSNDPWRIFSEFKGKLTKTVEEKLSEIKSKENSPSKFYKTSSKDNSSVSDSEEQSYSECSAAKGANTMDDLEMSSDDEPSLGGDKTPTAISKILSSPSKLRNRKNMKITYVKEQDEILLETINSRTKGEEEEIESGIEACEELLTNPMITVVNPTGFVDLRPRAPPPPPPDHQPKKSMHKMMIASMILVLTYCFPRFMSGFLFGLSIASVCFYFYYNFLCNFDFSDLRAYKDGKKRRENLVPIIEVAPVKEYHSVSKFEGWMNEYPDVYNPYTYRIAMTQSVYLKLECNILKVSHTNSKIPKRAMWNEPNHNVTFTYHRLYNLHGAQVALLPKGLIHKRIWSKKYPICIILNKDTMYQNLPNNRICYKDDSETDNKKCTEGAKDASETSECIDKHQEEDDDKTEVEDVFADVDKEDEDGSVTDEWDTLNVDESSNETRLYLFGRTGRDKEDWFRRLVAATHYESAHSPRSHESRDDSKDESDNSVGSDVNNDASARNSEVTDATESAKAEAKEVEDEYLEYMTRLGQVAHRTEANYPLLHKDNTKHYRLFFRRKKLKHHDDETDGDKDKSKEKDKEKEKDDKIDDMDAHLWFNILLGRVMFDMNRNTEITANFQERIQRKLSTIKLPYFIEEIMISSLELGTESPHFHRVHPPMLDEKGLWVDMELTYDGVIKMSLVTKLNLMKLKEQAGRSEDNTRPTSPTVDSARSPMFNSDIEDSAESSSDEEGFLLSQPVANAESLQDPSLLMFFRNLAATRDAKSKKFLRMIDNIASSSLFQQATENKYIKRAMEGVSKTELKLTVEIRSLEGVLAVNISPPPSDRIWIGFRGNPKLVLCAKPAFGERSINLAHVTRWIEKKLLLEFQKFLVMPNMEDFICPVMIPAVPK